MLWETGDSTTQKTDGRHRHNTPFKGIPQLTIVQFTEEEKEKLQQLKGGSSSPVANEKTPLNPKHKQDSYTHFSNSDSDSDSDSDSRSSWWCLC